MFRIILALLLLLPLSHSLAGAYKWVDAEGNVHFGDRPPAEGAQEIKLPPPAPVSEAPNAAERHQTQRRMLDIYREDREKKRQQTAEQKRQRAEMERRCLAARDRLRSYKESILYDRADDGKRRALSDAERDAAIQGLETQIQQHCR